jgi:hypothetical protein
LKVIVKSPQVDPVVTAMQTFLSSFVPLGTHVHVLDAE